MRQVPLHRAGIRHRLQHLIFCGKWLSNFNRGFANLLVFPSQRVAPRLFQRLAWSESLHAAGFHEDLLRGERRHLGPHGLRLHSTIDADQGDIVTFFVEKSRYEAPLTALRQACIQIRYLGQILSHERDSGMVGDRQTQVHPTHVGFASNFIRRRTESLLRKIPAIMFVISLVVAASQAQIPTSGNVFFGYSFAQGDTFTGVGSAGINMNGWEGSAEGKFLPWIGAVADFDWHYGGHDLFDCTGPACRVSASRHEILFGPRVSTSFGRYTPYAQFLIGLAHQSNTGRGFSNSDTTFSTAIGGGLDYKLVKGVACRVQVDDVRSSLFHVSRNNIRISTGIVFRF